jgi:hypothetical protein
MKLDNHRQAQNYYMAAIEEQGEDTGWRIAKAIVRYPGARAGEEFVAWEESIDHHETDSKLVLRSATAVLGKSGKNPHFVGADEIWEWPHFKTLRQFRTGQAAQRNPFILCVSTVGDDITVPGYKRYMKDLAAASRRARRRSPLPADLRAHPKAQTSTIARYGRWLTPAGASLSTKKHSGASTKSHSSDDRLARRVRSVPLGVWQRGSQQWINDDVEWAFARASNTHLEQLAAVCSGFSGCDFASIE